MTVVIIRKQVNAISVKKQEVLRVKIANFNIPSGILQSNFTQKGSLLVGTGYGTFIELAPGANGAILVYNSGAAGGIGTTTLEAAFPPLFKTGLTLSNNASDANNDINIATGSCRDSADTFNMRLTTGLTKRLDASWAVGTGNGGLDAGSKANNTWYHIYLIRKDSDGSLDALFSTSATAPTMPSGYSYKRRIGAVKTDGSGIIGFKQYNNHFVWTTTPTDLSGGAATSATLVTLSTPLGIKVEAIMAIYTPGTNINCIVFDPDTPLSAGRMYGTNLQTTIYENTNTSSQVKYYVSSSSMSIFTIGWNESWLT